MSFHEHFLKAADALASGVSVVGTPPSRHYIIIHNAYSKAEAREMKPVFDFSSNDKSNIDFAVDVQFTVRRAPLSLLVHSFRTFKWKSIRLDSDAA